MINRIIRRIKRYLLFNNRIEEAQWLGITFHQPNFIYFNRFSEKSLVVDVGCAGWPDFSIHMMTAFGLRAVGVDPTKKHYPSLNKIVEKYSPQFSHLPAAVAPRTGKIEFNESLEHESGSILADHTNVLRDTLRTYEVDCFTLKDLARKIAPNGQPISFLKLDLEGIEYEIIDHLTAADLAPFDQIFVEFHHHAISHLSEKDTQRAVEKIESLGYRSFSLDNHNYLFFQ